MMDERLFTAAREGGLVLTVNDRLSRDLLEQYDERLQQSGMKAWLRPDIVSLAAWLSRCQLNLPGMPLFLNKSQLQYLWERIVSTDVEQSGNYLLQIPQTAKRALQAHHLLVKYAAEFGMDEAAEDHRAFLRWRKAWQKLAGAEKLHDAVETTWLVSEAISAGHFSLPDKIIFAGFDDMTPDILHLAHSMKSCGAAVDHWQPQPCLPICRQRVPAHDPADEVTRCARWAHALLTEKPGARIGVVAPQLESYRPLFEHIFTAELAPLALMAGEEAPAVFNISLGRGLDREGVIHAALRLLRLGLQVDYAEVSWLLRTPYLAKGHAEGAARAQADRELRRLRRFDWSLPRLTKTLTFLSRRYALAIPKFIDLLESASSELRNSVKHLPGFWAEAFATFLQRLGWPGDGSLSSREYQAVQHFRAALGELASLDAVSTPIDRSEAEKALMRMIRSVEFQPEGAGAPIQVLGLLESSGLEFEHLWVLGLHDAAMPGAPSPNPFIPLPLQRRYQMKRSDAEREYLFACQVASRLFASAPNLVLSWPVQEKGAEQRPSSFIKEVCEGQPLLADTSDPAWTLWQGRPSLEAIADSQGPPLSTCKPFTGGTGIIKDQALCPFRAFAHHRLKAEQLEVPDVGISNLSRGTLAHTALELFWDKTGDQLTLLSLDHAALNCRLSEVVDEALGRLEKEQRHDLPPRQRQIERQRLILLIGQWLEFERQRDSFRVLAAEKSLQVKVGKLLIRSRVDRIDELDDGTCAILDYKTGRTDPLPWLDDRITEPQLPVYSLGLSRKQIGAVMFAVVRGKKKESGFRGLSRSEGYWPGSKSRALEARILEKGWTSFEDILAHWNTTLPLLGDAFARGDAYVDPVDPELACKYCDLTGFCRVLEQKNALLEKLDG